jgi:soluble P-type ATPase
MPIDPTLRARVEQIIKDLQPELDELKVRLHLARADAKDEMAKWEQKLADSRVKAERVSDEAGDILEEKAKVIGAELRDAVERLKKLL